MFSLPAMLSRAPTEAVLGAFLLLPEIQAHERVLVARAKARVELLAPVKPTQIAVEVHTRRK